jgi:catechol 2,3-dioxygenase-like lactoylglutathione lyase family enzyme
MTQRVTLITHGVSDLKRARAFYEALGWRSRAGEDDDVVFFQIGGSVLSLWDRARLAQDSGVELGSGYGGITLAHNVGSPTEVDEIVGQAQQAGATISRAPAGTFWGGYSGVFLDPDGYPWEVAHNPHWALDDEGNVTLPA